MAAAAEAPHSLEEVLVLQLVLALGAAVEAVRDYWRSVESIAEFADSTANCSQPGRPVPDASFIDTCR